MKPCPCHWPAAALRPSRPSLPEAARGGGALRGREARPARDSRVAPGSGSPEGSGGGSRHRATLCARLNTRSRRRGPPALQAGGKIPDQSRYHSADGVPRPSGTLPHAGEAHPSFQVGAGVGLPHILQEQGPEPHSQVITSGAPCHRLLTGPKVCTVAKRVQTGSQRKSHTSKGIEQNKKTQKNPTPNFVSGLGSPWF